MLKIIAIILTSMLFATSVGAQDANPCLDGYQWYPDKKICARKLPESAAPAVKAKCKPGATRKQTRTVDGRRVTTVQTCGFAT